MQGTSSVALWSSIILLMLASFGIVPTQQGLALGMEVVGQSTSCFSTYTSGIGATLMKICISDHGNLVQFESPQSFEHIQINSSGEGYVVCSSLPGSISQVHGWDAGFAEAGFEAPAIAQPNGPNTFPLTITRTTADGIFRLAQDFARDTTKKDVTITMTLTNLSASSRTGVRLARYFDGNIDNDRADDRYARNRYSVGGWENSSEGHGLRLTALTTDQAIAQSIFIDVETFTTWNPLGTGLKTAQGCAVAGAGTDNPRDFIGRLTYNLGTLNVGQSKTVQVLYQRF